MLIPAFQLHLNERIQRGQATIGKFDGKHACLAAATIGGKIFIHNPHQTAAGSGSGSADGKAVTFLNINKQITSVVAGQLLPSSNRDVLLVGTPSNLQCYDVENNRDLFFKDVGDGVNSIVVGQFGHIEQPLVIVGGNCSIQVRGWEVECVREAGGRHGDGGRRAGGWVGRRRGRREAVVELRITTGLATTCLKFQYLHAWQHGPRAGATCMCVPERPCMRAMQAMHGESAPCKPCAMKAMHVYLHNTNRASHVEGRSPLFLRLLSILVFDVSSLPLFFLQGSDVKGGLHVPPLPLPCRALM